MLGKIVVIGFLCMAVSSEPIKRSIIPNDISTLLNDQVELLEVVLKPESITSLVNVFKNIIGYKISAVTLAVNVLKWIVANFVGVVIGGIIALGVCKITGKCNLNYDQSFSKLCSFITPERLNMAQNLLTNAVRRFADDPEEDAVNFE